MSGPESTVAGSTRIVGALPPTPVKAPQPDAFKAVSLKVADFKRSLAHRPADQEPGSKRG